MCSRLRQTDNSIGKLIIQLVISRNLYFLNFQNLNRDTILEASNGKHTKAIEVFTHSIKYLHTRSVEVIRERTGDENFSSADVQWVITVPAIWKPAAKQFMREAAYQVLHFISMCNFRLFLLNSTNHASLV